MGKYKYSILLISFIFVGLIAGWFARGFYLNKFEELNTFSIVNLRSEPITAQLVFPSGFESKVVELKAGEVRTISGSNIGEGGLSIYIDKEKVDMGNYLTSYNPKLFILIREENIESFFAFK